MIIYYRLSCRRVVFMFNHIHFKKQREALDSSILLIFQEIRKVWMIKHLIRLLDELRVRLLLSYPDDDE